MKGLEHTIKQYGSPILRILARGRCANPVLLGRNWWVVSRLQACTPIPVHDLWLLRLRLLLLRLLLHWWLVVSTRYPLASGQPRLLLGVTGVRGRLSILRLRLIMLIVNRGRLVGWWLHVVRLLRWWWLGRRRLLVRRWRWSSVRRLGLWWDVQVLSRDIHATIALTCTEPPLESSALLILWRSVIL